MTEDRTGRELTPTSDSPVTPTPVEGGAVDRFSASQSAHTIGLTEERAAQVVQQSGRARAVAFLAILLVALFIPVYWFYDIGVPALGIESRTSKEANAQMVNDVSQGYALFENNCARCHGDQGQGGIGPPLNDQAKLYNAVTAQGLPGTGHLNPNYITTVLTVGGRYVCGDANSVMPVWLQPGGPLNYRQVQEIVAWLTASKDITFEYTPAQAETGAGPAPTAETVSGWRDPQYTPQPGATPVPACWRNPSGQIGGGGGGATASEAPVASPGTADSPRVIKLDLTGQLTITDPSGTQASSIAVVPGETVKFEVTNTAGFDHNFWVGAPSQLASGNTTGAVGVQAFGSGTQTVTWTVPANATAGEFQFACILPGHYQTMHGNLNVVASGGSAAGAGGSPAAGESAAPSAGESAAPSAAPSAAEPAAPSSTP
jgi:mono/diheme cytochrome c family protein/uncharacterized cupredoxin-like copper-binding protein